MGSTAVVEDADPEVVVQARPLPDMDQINLPFDLVRRIFFGRLDACERYPIVKTSRHPVSVPFQVTITRLRTWRCAAVVSEERRSGGQWLRVVETGAVSSIGAHGAGVSMIVHPNRPQH